MQYIDFGLLAFPQSVNSVEGALISSLSAAAKTVFNSIIFKKECVRLRIFPPFWIIANKAAVRRAIRFRGSDSSQELTVTVRSSFTLATLGKIIKIK